MSCLTIKQAGVHALASIFLSSTRLSSPLIQCGFKKQNLVLLAMIVATLDYLLVGMNLSYMHSLGSMDLAQSP
jgi:hypothetical protein